MLKRNLILPRGTAFSSIAHAVRSTLPAILLVSAIAATPASAQITITRTSGDVFYMDTTKDLFGMYASYLVTNGTGADLDEAWAGIGSFGGGSVGLAANEPGLVKIGDLADGATKAVFFYLVASAETTTDQTHTVTVYDDKPAYGGTSIGSQGFTFTAVEETIAALANKVTTVVTGPNPPGLGGIVTVTVTGKTGTIGNSKILSYTPATYADWPADAYQLVSTQIVLTGGNTGTLTNQLYTVVANKAATDYTATYRFKAVGTTSQPSYVSPVGYIASGEKIKHTDTSDFGAGGTLDPVLPADNKVRLTSKSPSVSTLDPTGGTVTYTVTFENTGTIDSSLDEIIDTLPTSPASPTYVAGTSKIGGTPIGDPIISGSTLTWPDGMTITAGSTQTLQYSVAIPGTDPGVFTNSVVGMIGSEQIDTTLDTSDPAPATADVTVPGEADLSVNITVDNPSPSIGEQFTYTITLSNSGPHTATSVELAAFTNSLPAGVTFVSATPSAGTYDRQFWDVGDVASGTAPTLTITFEVTADGGYELLAEIAVSAIDDPDSTPYNGSTTEDDDDSLVVTTTGGTGGGSAGLESNGTLAGTLAQLMFDRRMRQAETGGSFRLPRFQHDAMPTASKEGAFRSSAVLRSIIPEAGPEGSIGYETSPEDLLPVTNADDVVAVDFLRDRDARRVGVFFGTVTRAGTLYDHTKVICDRLKGAVLTSVQHIEVAGRPFVLARLEHPSGAVDYAISLNAYQIPGGFVVDSRFRLDEYETPAGASDVLNLQVWSVSRTHAARLAEQVVRRLERIAPVRYANTDAAPPELPKVYVRTGRYVNGSLQLELFNEAGESSIRLTGGTMSLTERSDRIAFEREVILPAANEDHIVTVDLPLGPVFDASFFVETPGGSRDQMYLADGAWSYSFDGQGAVVDDFTIEAAPSELAAKDGHFEVERSVRMQGEVTTWAVLFRYLQANGRAVDLSEHQYVEFTARGSGQMRVLFEKESVHTSDHYGTVVKLTEQDKVHRIWFDDLRRPDGTGRLDASDLLLLSFYVIGQQGRSTTFDLTVSDFRFGGAPGDPLAEVPEDFELKQNYPNPFNPRTQIEYGLRQPTFVRLRVYDTLGRLVTTLVDRWMDEGRHTVPFDAGTLASGVYLYRLEIEGHQETRLMTLLR